MIVTFTKKELELIEKKEAEAKQRYEEARERARTLRPEAPEPPYTGNESNEEALKIYEDWEKSGSDEWRKAHREEIALSAARYGKNTTRSELLRKADDRLLKKITKTQTATVKALKAQLDVYLQSEIMYLSIKHDDEGLREAIDELFYKPVQTLDADHKAELDRYIDSALEALTATIGDEPTYVTSFGLSVPLDPKAKESPYYSIYYLVPSEELPRHETTEERDYYVTRPKDYVTTVDRPTQKLFNNALTKPLDADAEALYDVRLDRKDRVSVRVAIDYSEVLSKGTLLELPELNQRDYNVHDAIITQLCAGNRVMSYDMIYRAMTGKVGGKITVPDEARKIIDEALDKFRGTFKLEYTYIEDGKEMVESYDEPLVTFRRLVKKEKINGKVITGGIALSDDTKLDPPLLKWARFNGNEIDTRDITLLDVPSLNNGDESFTIKMCLYRRVISMRNSFERKYHSKKELPDNLRSIRYDYVYSMIGLDEPNVDKRKLVKNKIDRCMSYWKDKGLIADYRHKKDKSAGNAFYAVEVSFMASGK